MRAFGEIEIYDKKRLAFAFRHVDGVTKLYLGDDGVCFQMQVADHEEKSNIARLDLPKELAIAATAKAVFEQVHLQDHMSRDGKRLEGAAFPDICAEVRVDPFTVPSESRRVFGVWARRMPVPQVVAA